MCPFNTGDCLLEVTALTGLTVCIILFLVFQIRSDIRNEWAHCNLSTWNNLKYLGSFQKMNRLVKNMNLAPADEARILAELSKWELNGNLQKDI